MKKILNIITFLFLINYISAQTIVGCATPPTGTPISSTDIVIGWSTSITSNGTASATNRSICLEDPNDRINIEFMSGAIGSYNNTLFFRVRKLGTSQYGAWRTIRRSSGVGVYTNKSQPVGVLEYITPQSVVNDPCVDYTNSEILGANTYGSVQFILQRHFDSKFSNILTIDKVSCTCPNNCYWSLNGNSNVSASNFIGSRNAEDVVMKANNVEKVRLTSSGQIKLLDLDFTTTPLPNVVIGTDGTLYKTQSTSLRTGSTTSTIQTQKELEDLKQEVKNLKEQVKALLESKNYSPCTVLQPTATIEVVPTPFNSNAKAKYSIDGFTGKASLQIADISGKVLKTIPLSQAKGTVEIGNLETTSSNIIFSIVNNGKVVATKNSIKITE